MRDDDRHGRSRLIGCCTSAHVPSLPVAERAAQAIISLPTYPHRGEGEIAFISEAVDRALTDWGARLELAS